MPRKLSIVSILVLLIAAALLLGAQRAQQPATTQTGHGGTGNLPSKQTVEAFLQKWFGYDTSVKFDVVNIKASEDPSLAYVLVRATNGQGQQQALPLYVTPDGKHAITGEILPFGTDPFAPVMSKLRGSLNGATRGAADSKVLIVEFGDLECPSCKQAQPVIDKLLADNPGVRFIFQNFPLTQIHPWALKASSYADCIARSNPAAFWKFAQTTYEAQAAITPENADAKLAELATTAGMDAAKVSACAATPETKAHIDASTQMGIDAGVNGTPTLFFNGRRVANVTGTPYDFLNKLAKFNPEGK